MAKRKPAQKQVKKNTKKNTKKQTKKKGESPPPSSPLHPARLTPVQLVELLKKAGAKDVTITNIATDVAGGLPVNHDPPGTINLIVYAAWLHHQRRTT